MNSFPIAATAFSRRGMYMPNFALLMFLACSTALTTTAAGQSGLKAVSLKVTVNAKQQFYPFAATDVSPDVLGPYVDGQKGVCASLDTNGDLTMNLSCKGNSASRQFGVVLSYLIAPPTVKTDSCTPLKTISPSNPPAYTNWISTWQAADPPTAAFQNMNVDATGNTIYDVRFTIATGFSDAPQTTYFLSYHRTDGLFPADAALASYAEVRRLSSTQWVVEPVTPSGLAGNPTNVAMLVEQTTTTTTTGHKSTTTTPNTECGFYTVPFSFTLDKN